MRFRTLLPIALLLLLPILLRAQSFGVLSGTVADRDGNPYAGAAVEVLKTSPRLGSYARPDGSYRVTRLRPGTYRVVTQIPPYRFKDTLVVTIKAGATEKLDIRFDRKDLAEMVSKDERTREGKDGRLRSRSSMKMEGGYAMSMPTAPAEGSSRMMMGSGAAMARTESLVADAEAPHTSSARMSAPKGMGEKATSDDGTIPSSGRSADTIGDLKEPRREAGQLTAGEWSDLENWPYWLDVASSPEWKEMVTHWGCDPSTRVTVRLVDGASAVVDAELRLVDGQGKVLWNARTDNRGRAELFAGTTGAKGEYRLELKNHGTFQSAGMVTAGNKAPYLIKLPGAASRRDEFDLMFVVDATGSMGDEMSYIKAELESVIDRNREASNEDLRLRLSCNFYRDEGDDYVVRPFAFDESTFEMIGNLRQQEAGGGGDTPEAVEEALEDAIEKHDWSARARARLLFLVLDAPPHYTPERCEKIRTLAARAAEKGIRIIPIASSGVDKETEFLLRLLDIYTGGTYLFLTDDSGIGGSHMKPTVGSYNVEYLNDLMVKVMARYLAIDALSADEGTGMELN